MPADRGPWRSAWRRRTVAARGKVFRPRRSRCISAAPCGVTARAKLTAPCTRASARSLSCSHIRRAAHSASGAAERVSSRIWAVARAWPSVRSSSQSRSLSLTGSPWRRTSSRHRSVVGSVISSFSPAPNRAACSPSEEILCSGECAQDQRDVALVVCDARAKLPEDIAHGTLGEQVRPGDGKCHALWWQLE